LNQVILPKNIKLFKHYQKLAKKFMVFFSKQRTCVSVCGKNRHGFREGVGENAQEKWRRAICKQSKYDRLIMPRLVTDRIGIAAIQNMGLLFDPDLRFLQ
jgi:hypothetical protein